MKLSIYNPKQSLNKAYLKEKVSRENIELFKKNLSTLLGKINEKESEEHLKNVISEFLKDTWYKETNEINTKDRQDLVIHTGKTTKEPVGVILEVKKPSNKTEMMSEAKPNAKAMHELILYYLRERIDHSNIDIKYLVVTNIYEWFIIDEVWFEKNVFRNVKLKKDFENWRLSGNDTRFFYESIAKPFLESLTEKIECTYFDIRPFTEVISNEDKKDDIKLISLYKILSPVHLLKKPFANDSNSLDTKFYTELLHIIGLEEVKDGGKKLIKRKEKPDTASILENTIMKLEDKDCLRNIANLSSFGADKQEQLFNVALELGITWINRVLFLKLLEAQLYKYHKGNGEYVFLNNKTIHDFDELSNLFFQVLAEKQSTRRTHLKEKYKRVPYLNSSLFERTELERQTFDISGLDNNLDLNLISSSVLKNEQGKRKSGGLPTLQYLFDFLDAYDFTSEGSEEIQEQNKNLINASVLGLIFEKINGYKDGSFFTPGFVTMYMCRETIRKSVVQKFNEKYTIDCDTFDDLKNFVASRFKAKDILEFNKVINDLKICDPAVGSGHFLVSALNEVIAIKAELGILADKEGIRLSGYEVNIVNDELIITYNDNTEIFEYSVTGNSIAKDAQRVQKTLFHEKESIIENSLFGVDINPNSVKICRLRLWIELLKNAYYTEESKFSELETLPNIDINIKCGNSLISRFPLDADLKKALKGKWNIDTYKIAVHAYHEAENKEEKRKLEELIDTIKKDFRTEIGINDKRRKDLVKFKQELYLLTLAPKLALEVDVKKGGKKKEKDKIKKLGEDITKLEDELKAIEENRIYQNAFEWRFEFPEVLDNDGRFLGFDVVIGNPPYIYRNFDFSISKNYFVENYQSNEGNFDLYKFFVERINHIIRNNGISSFIIPNTFLSAKTYAKLRKLMIQNFELIEFFDLGQDVFEGVTVENIVFQAKKKIGAENSASTVKISRGRVKNMSTPDRQYVIDIGALYLREGTFNVYLDTTTDALIEKIRQDTVELGTLCYCTVGINTGYIKDDLVADSKIDSTYHKLINGRDIGPYRIDWPGQWIKYDKEFVESFGDLGRTLPPKYIFDKPKILVQRTRRGMKRKLVCAYDDKRYYNLNRLSNIVLTDENTSLKVILAVLNSQLMDYYFNKVFNEYEVKPLHLALLPIKKFSKKQNSDLEKLVEQAITEAENSNDAALKLIQIKVDEIVYSAYGITEAERRAIQEYYSEMQ